jgi:predicted DNA-binding transcriptional regulator AlpA
LRHVRLCLRTDVVAYASETPFPARQPNELRGLYLTLPEVPTLAGISRRQVDLALAGLPAPAVRIGNAKLWLRAEVERWLSR